LPKRLDGFVDDLHVEVIFWLVDDERWTFLKEKLRFALNVRRPSQ